MYVYAEALHYRAKAARAEAQLAAEKLKSVLLDFVVTNECGARLAPHIVQAIKELAQYEPCVSMSRCCSELGFTDYMAGIRGPLRDAYISFYQQREAADSLTSAAQNLKYRATL
jgi:hypothetical protein